MSKERIQIAPEFRNIMPPEYIELVDNATWGKEGRGWKDVGINKELIEEHSLCAGCPESMAFRYILAALPNPEDTVMVGSTGCTSLVFPHVAVHNIHSLFGNQNAIASGLKKSLAHRFPDQTKDVVVLAGDGATVDIGLDYTLQSWFRQEKFTTICFDNELYANTGGQESGLMQKGFVAKNGAHWKAVRKGSFTRDCSGIGVPLCSELYGQQTIVGGKGRQKCRVRRTRDRPNLSPDVYALHS